MNVAVLNLLQEINERLKRVEARQTKRVEKNAKRRKQYKDSTVRRDQGMFRLPEKNMIKYRDVRLGPLFKRWAERPRGPAGGVPHLVGASLELLHVPQEADHL